MTAHPMAGAGPHGMRFRPALLLLLLVLSARCGGTEPTAPDGESELERLRSLPYAGFSKQPSTAESGAVIHDAEQWFPGLTLYTVQMLSRAELIDESGAVVRVWRLEPGGRWERSRLLADGDLLVIGADSSGLPGEGIPDEARYLARFDWDGRLLWKRRMQVHHDIEPTTGGRFLALGFRRRIVPELDREIDTRDDQVLLLDGDGSLIETRSILDAFRSSPGVHRLRPTRPNRLGVRPWIDLLHANSVEPMRHPRLVGRHPIYDTGNLLLCFRHQDCIAVLDGNEARLVWAWGEGELQGPHDARVLENGNILVFDNGLGRGWSRVIEIEPVAGRIVWEYHAPHPTDFFTVSKGSSQRLPNGNTLIANSDSGEAFEVTEGGEIVWSFRVPYRDARGRRASIVRAVRYDRPFIETIEGSRSP